MTPEECRELASGDVFVKGNGVYLVLGNDTEKEGVSVSCIAPHNITCEELAKLLEKLGIPRS